MGEKTRRGLFFARGAATELGGADITPEHLLIGIARADPSALDRLIGPSDSSEAIVSDLGKFLTSSPDRALPKHSDSIPFSDASRTMLQQAMVGATGLSTDVIRPEHLLLAILQSAEGEAARRLKSRGLSAEGLREKLARGRKL